MTYAPDVDSFLLRNWLEKQNLENKKVLDMGTGSGILAITAAENGGDVTGADIDDEAIEAARQNARNTENLEKIEFKRSDLFSNIKKDFDVIVFNPPYLPGEEIDEEDQTWHGGETGIEVTEEFLADAPDYLDEDGEIVFVASSRADLESLESKYDLEVLDSEKLWFETLYLLKRA